MKNQRFETELESVLFNRFDADVVPDYENLMSYLKHPNFPEREKQFKQELANAILKDTISPQTYEDLTNHELETQEEVNEFLITDVWQPLYGDEPIKA